MIQIVNKHYHTPTKNDFYIGRGSPLGNPYTSLKDKKTKAKHVCDSREESVEKYRIYLLKEIAERNPVICNELNKIFLAAKKANENNRVIYLVCFCKPKLCHGDIIKNIIEQKINDK